MISISDQFPKFKNPTFIPVMSVSCGRYIKSIIDKKWKTKTNNFKCVNILINNTYKPSHSCNHGQF